MDKEGMIREIDKEIARLQRVKELLQGQTEPVPTIPDNRLPESSRVIRLAQKLRWARAQLAVTKKPETKRNIEASIADLKQKIEEAREQLRIAKQERKSKQGA
jgi:hypothetical protein